MYITVDNSYPLNHLPIIAAYAITKFSEAQPKITLPTNIIQNILKAPPNATIVYATTIIALKNRIPNLTPLYNLRSLPKKSIIKPPISVKNIFGNENAEYNKL